MNIDHLAGVLSAKLGRQNLHVTGQHHHVGFVLLEQLVDMSEGLSLVLFTHRHMVVRNLVPLHHTAQIIVVGNHRNDLAVELFAVPTVQQIGQAV